MSTELIGHRWELHDAMFSIANMERKICSCAKELDFTETIKAVELMKEYHKGQVRKGKDQVPYIIHPLMIACHAFALGIGDDHLIAACLLHDVMEDSRVTAKDLRDAGVNEEVVEIVELVSFFENPGISHKEAKKAYFERIATNRKACMVKLLDRCNNISTMATGFTSKHIADYIDETEEYILPLLDKVKHEYGEYYNTAFLLKYQMLSVIETVKRTL
ncbi:MAG: HD domain-containing protein [Lachnospiraceae bacterium]|nr:HD domain-containing protein [Lachnospiraceae bacterium]